MDLRPTIPREMWLKVMNETNIRKNDMNRLVMNFLEIEAYVEVAQMFNLEALTEHDNELFATITDRANVKKAVISGKVEDAVEIVNALDPQILATNPQLYFHLEQRKMITLVRNKKVKEALQFGQDVLAPIGEKNESDKSLVDELERTFALLGFEDPSNSPVAYLMAEQQLPNTISEINAAILTSQNLEKDPKIVRLLKKMVWIEQELDNRTIFPLITDLSTAAL